jgi:hypothetical protein
MDFERMAGWLMGRHAAFPSLKPHPAINPHPANNPLSDHQSAIRPSIRHQPFGPSTSTILNPPSSIDIEWGR